MALPGEHYPKRKRRPRLDAEWYVGEQLVFITICAAHREGNLTRGVTPSQITFAMGDAAGRSEHLILAWIVMPDHIHVLAQGRSLDADARQWVRLFKARSSMAYKRRTGEALWQSSWHDCVMRANEDAATVCGYIFDNPVRQGLCKDWSQWSWSGGRIYEEMVERERRLRHP